MARKTSLKIGALANWASLGVNIVIGLLLTPYILSNLGKTGYGIWTLVSSFIGYYGLLNLGVTSAISRYIARNSALGDAEESNKVYSTSMVAVTLTGLVALTISFACAGPAADFFQIYGEEREQFTTLIRIIGFTTLINFQSSVHGSVVIAKEQFLAVSVITIFRALLRTALVIIFIENELGVIGLGLAPLIATSLAALCTYILKRKSSPELHFTWKHANVSTLKILYSFGGVTFIITIADLLRFNLDSFVIGKFIGIEAVAIYGVATLITKYNGSIISSAMSVLSPRFTQLDATGDKEQLHGLIRKALSTAATLSFGTSLIAYFVADIFIELWAGPEYAASANVLKILIFVSGFALSQNPTISLLTAKNKHHIYATFTIVEAVCNLVLSLLLVSKFGIIGVALGTAIPQLIIKIVVMPIAVSKTLEVPITTLYKLFIGPGTTTSILVLAWTFLIQPKFGSGSIIETAVALAVSLIVYAVACLLSAKFIEAFNLPNLKLRQKA